MKRVISLCLAAIIISLSFASCGKNPMEQNDTEDQNGSTNEQVTQIIEGTPILATDDALSKLEEMLGYFLSPSVDFDINEPDVETKITGYLLSKITHYRSLIDYYELYYQKSMDYYDDYTLVSVTYKEEDIAGIMFDVFGLEPSKKPSPGTWTYDAETNTYSENFLDTGYIFQDVTITDTQEDDGYYSFEVKSKEYLNTNKKYAGIRYYSVKAMLCYLNGEQQWRLVGVTPLDKEPTEKDKALLAYANLLMDELSNFGNTAYFCFAYIDSDEIPELIIHIPVGRIPTETIYYFDGEKAELVADLHARFDLRYLPRESIIIEPFFALKGSSEMTTIYLYKDGKIEENRVFKKLSSTNPDDNAYYEYSDDEEYTYYIDDSEVTYDEYISEMPEGELALPEESIYELTAEEIAKI